MPKYSYKCQDCENKFDVELSIKEKEEASSKGKTPACPKCKSENTKQVFSMKSFFSKDSGGCGGGCCGCSGH